MKVSALKVELFSFAGIIGSMLAKQLGGWDLSMQALVGFMAIDYITGFIVAGVFKKSGKTEDGRLESRAGFKGLCRKGVTLLIVYMGAQLDLLTGQDLIRNAVVIGFLANEALSIIENTGLMGVPMPEVVTKAIEILKNKEV